MVSPHFHKKNKNSKLFSKIVFMYLNLLCNTIGIKYPISLHDNIIHYSLTHILSF